MNNLAQQKNAVKWLRIIYPCWAILGVFSLLYVPSELIDKTNPELTVANLLEQDTLFRISIVGRLIAQLFSIAAVWFLYKLFYDSFKDLTILTAIFAFIGMPIAMVSVLFEVAALDVLDNASQVMIYLNLAKYGTIIASIFWGLWLLPLGFMIIKSPLFPRIIGWVVVAAGVGYTLSAFAYFLGAEGILLEVLDTLTIGEMVWMIWVMILGAKWKALEN